MQFETVALLIVVAGVVVYTLSRKYPGGGGAERSETPRQRPAQLPQREARVDPAAPEPGTDTPRGRAYPIAVVGEQYPNRDGSDRQSVIQRLQPGAVILLVREPDNPRDPNAVHLTDAQGQGVGYLDRDRAVQISEQLRTGAQITAEVRQVLPPNERRDYWALVLTVYF
jgi:hypothetical protein